MLTESRSIVVHYGEIGTKGKNRPHFVRILRRNIRRALRDLPLASIEETAGRLWLVATEGCTFGHEALERLGTVFGLSHFALALQTSHEMEAMQQAAWQLLEGRSYETFRVRARRAYKNLPYDSQAINEAVGGYILARRATPVKMKGADVEVHIDTHPKGAYIYADKHYGLGGLPVGVTGKVAVLLSGGIDSPVAAFRMQRRGCHGFFVHFHSAPFVSRASADKAQDLAEHLVRYQGEGVLALVPFGKVQREIVQATPAPLRVVLYRRMMLRIAGALAQQHRARVLVTGESLAQVASQTLNNMVAIEDAAPLTVLRPLIGYDKQEIIAEAQKLGTYETSIQPDQDCCSLFVPKHPETQARLARVRAAESLIDVDALCQAALDEVETVYLRAPWLSKAPGEHEALGEDGELGNREEHETPETVDEDADA